jgi:M6 family metalloprotease-like protein
MMPKPFLSYGGMGFGATWSQRERLVQDAIHVADGEVDFREFVQVIVVVPRVDLIGYASHKWAASTNDGVVVNRATVQREDRPPSLFAHEMGHSLGLRDMYDHELAAKMGSSDAAAIYVGPWDLMSMAFRGFIHFSSYNKIKLGWISTEHVRTVSRGEVATITVERIETPSDGIQTVKIPLAGSRYYLLEARSRVCFDKGLPDEGLLIMLIDEATQQDGFVRVQDANRDTASLDDATFDARTGKVFLFTDPRNDIAVMVLHSVGSGLRIHITTGEKEQVALDAWTVVHEANNTIQEAEEEGRLLGLEEARSLLQKALASFCDGEYETAVNLSGQAKVLAEKASKPTATATTAIIETTSCLPISEETVATETPATVTATGQSTGGIFTVEVIAVLGVVLVILIATGVFSLRRRGK